MSNMNDACCLLLVACCLYLYNIIIIVVEIATQLLLSLPTRTLWYVQIICSEEQKFADRAGKVRTVRSCMPAVVRELSGSP